MILSSVWLVVIYVRLDTIRNRSKDKAFELWAGDQTVRNVEYRERTVKKRSKIIRLRLNSARSLYLTPSYQIGLTEEYSRTDNCSTPHNLPASPAHLNCFDIKEFILNDIKHLVCSFLSGCLSVDSCRWTIALFIERISGWRKPKRTNSKNADVWIRCSIHFFVSVI